MKSVIFLDFDGPLFPEKIFLYPQNEGDFSNNKCRELNFHPKVSYWYADPFAITILNKLKEKYNYQLVISSSWTNLHEKEQIESLLKVNGLNYEFHNDWKTNKNSEERRLQIEEWLSCHPEVTEYMIFDDTKSAPELFFDKTYEKSTLNQRYVYLAHEQDGFNYEQYLDMDFLFSLWEEKKRKSKI